MIKKINKLYLKNFLCQFLVIYKKTLLIAILLIIVCPGFAATNSSGKQATKLASSQSALMKDFIQNVERSGLVKVFLYEQTPVNGLYVLITNYGNWYVAPSKNILISKGEMVNYATKANLTQALRVKVLQKLKRQLKKGDKHLPKPAINPLPQPEKIQRDSTSQTDTPFQQEKLRYMFALGGNAKQVAKNLKKLSNQLGVLYPAIGKKVGTLTVFGRPGCEFCHELFQQTSLLQHHGIAVRYIFAPVPDGYQNGAATDKDIMNTLRSGEGQDLAKVLCVANKKEAFKQYVNDGVAPKISSTPNCNGFAYAALKLMYGKDQMGINHTPILVSDQGKIAIGIREGHILKEVLALFKKTS